MTKILTIEEVKKEESVKFKEYEDGTYAYNKNNGYWHLIKDWKDLFEWKNVYAYYYHQSKWGYEYQDGTGDWHVFKDWKNHTNPYR